MIKVGEYVRTYHHGIVKIIDVYYFDVTKKEKVCLTDTKRELLNDKFEFIKHSKNIIELLEKRRLCKL